MSELVADFVRQSYLLELRRAFQKYSLALPQELISEDLQKHLEMNLVGAFLNREFLRSFPSLSSVYDEFSSLEFPLKFHVFLNLNSISKQDPNWTASNELFHHIIDIYRLNPNFIRGKITHKLSSAKALDGFAVSEWLINYLLPRNNKESIYLGRPVINGYIVDGGGSSFTEKCVWNGYFLGKAGLTG